jgi:hypothetical protein
MIWAGDEGGRYEPEGPYGREDYRDAARGTGFAAVGQEGGEQLMTDLPSEPMPEAL